MEKVKIALGSSNDDKANILKETFADLFKKEIKVIKVSVASKISDQPIGERETLQGAINRARAAFAEQPGVYFAVGLEGGLVKIQKRFFLVCIAVIYDKENLCVGVSSKLALPKAVSKRIEKGEFFGTVIRQYAQTLPKEKYLSQWLQMLISRKTLFKEAIRNAYLVYLNSSQ